MRNGLPANHAPAPVIPAALAAKPGRALGDIAILYRDYRTGDVVAEAGDVGHVTVSTQMAGRGTDIRLESDERVGAAERKYRKRVRRGLIDPDEEILE